MARRLAGSHGTITIWRGSGTVMLATSISRARRPRWSTWMSSRSDADAGPARRREKSRSIDWSTRDIFCSIVDRSSPGGTRVPFADGPRVRLRAAGGPRGGRVPRRPRADGHGRRAAEDHPRLLVECPEPVLRAPARLLDRQRLPPRVHRGHAARRPHGGRV